MTTERKPETSERVHGDHERRSAVFLISVNVLTRGTCFGVVGRFARPTTDRRTARKTVGRSNPLFLVWIFFSAQRTDDNCRGGEQRERTEFRYNALVTKQSELLFVLNEWPTVGGHRTVSENSIFFLKFKLN